MSDMNPTGRAQSLEVLEVHARQAVDALWRTALAVTARLVLAAVPDTTHIVIESLQRRARSRLLEIHTQDGPVWTVWEDDPHGPAPIPRHEVNAALELAHRGGGPDAEALGWARVTLFRPWWCVEINDEACAPAAALRVAYRLPARYVVPGMVLASGRTVLHNTGLLPGLHHMSSYRPLPGPEPDRLAQESATVEIHDDEAWVDLVIPPVTDTTR